MNIFKILLFVTIVLFVFSCKESVPEATIEKDGRLHLEAVVTNAAGTSWTDDGSTYLAAPFNVCEYMDMELLLLSDAVKKGKHVDVIPIGAIHIQEDEQQRYIMIGVPAEGGESIDIRSFGDLVTKHSSAKWIIEQYVLNRNGMGSAKLIGWKDESVVTNKLLNNNI